MPSFFLFFFIVVAALDKRNKSTLKETKVQNTNFHSFFKFLVVVVSYTLCAVLIPLRYIVLPTSAGQLYKRKAGSHA